MNFLEPFLLGGVASCSAELVTFPIDFVKTRLQVQGQLINLTLNNQKKCETKYYFAKFKLK
jgi:hypothetical protein